MKKILHRFGKFYSNVIVNYIGIFIFVGILSVVFGDYGWLPNKNIYAISQFVYQAVIPILIAYAAGNQVCRSQSAERETRRKLGGSIAIMATSGMIVADNETGILAAMLLGPLCGILWNYVLEPLVAKAKSGLEMLARNIVAALTGCILALLSFYIFAPIISTCVNAMMLGVNYLIGHKLIWLSSIVIEPAKVFFLNNSINHGLLVPLGIQQSEQTGESLLFLLEANPGPGFGLLTALYLKNKKKREKYAASMFVEFVGGIHEIYFPDVIANLWLLPALICGGVAGNFCFLTLHGATTGVISPGSILTVGLMCAPKRMLSVLIGIAVSAAVSAAVAICILQWQEKHTKEKQTDSLSDDSTQADQCMEHKMKKIGFICNAGVGSSAMGAALFRRKLKELNITELEVEAYAADQIPEDLDVAICQKDLRDLLLSDLKTANLYTVDNLLNQSEYMAIIENIRKKGGCL